MCTQFTQWPAHQQTQADRDNRQKQQWTAGYVYTIHTVTCTPTDPGRQRQQTETAMDSRLCVHNSHSDLHTNRPRQTETTDRNSNGQQAMCTQFTQWPAHQQTQADRDNRQKQKWTAGYVYTIHTVSCIPSDRPPSGHIQTQSSQHQETSTQTLCLSLCIVPCVSSRLFCLSA